MHVPCRLYSGGYHRNCMEEVSNAVHCTKVASNVLYQEMALMCGTPVVSSDVQHTENRLSRHLGLNFSLLRKICETTKCLDA